jgi:hypothetical protein
MAFPSRSFAWPCEPRSSVKTCPRKAVGMAPKLKRAWRQHLHRKMFGSFAQSTRSQVSPFFLAARESLPHNDKTVASLEWFPQKNLTTKAQRTQR